jgi:hypothetical protein
MSLHQHSGYPRSRTDQYESEPQSSSFWRSKAGLVTAGFLLIVAFLLLSEHWAHALGFLPFLLLLACPLMHVFMHSGHGGHAGHAGHRAADPRTDGPSASSEES